MKRKLLSAVYAFIGISAAWAQGTWNAPAVPGVNPLEASGNVYLYNIEADAFANSGMNWATQAVATRLQQGDEVADERHALTIQLTDGQKFSMSLNQVKGAANSKYIGCASDNANDVWADYGSNYEWTANESDKYENAYTLQNSTYSKDLDVQWLYGGRLTIVNGQGFYDWAFIPAESINDGSYAKFKERRKMYAIYQELVNTGNVSKYSEALSAANAVYVNTDASKDALIAATRTLLIAVADGIENPVNANFLFDNADILGNNDATAWGGPTSFKATNGVFEDWHGNCGVNPLKLTQSKAELPNGLYDVVFHGLYRQDGSNAETAPHLTVTGTNILEDDLNTIAALGSQWGVSNGGTNQDEGQTQWTGDPQVPNHQWGANQGMTLEDAVAKINNVQVKEGNLTIELAITGSSQWVLFQGFDIIYNGPINVALYKKLVAAQDEANGYVSEKMNAEVKSKLENAVVESESLTSNSDEEELNDALEALTSAIKDAVASIEVYKEIAAALTDLQKGDETFNPENYINATYDNVDGLYNDYYAYEVENLSKDAYTDYTSVIINPGFEFGNTRGWTYVSSQDTGVKETSNNEYKMEKSEGSYLFNTYWKGNPITQTISNLPAGYYQLKAVVASAAEAKIYLMANDKYEGFQSENKSIGVEGSIIAEVGENGILTIGVVGAGEDLEYREDGYWWYKVDNFRLTYFGENLPNVTVSITNAGYATFSSEYPLDLSNIENGTAYIVADDAEGEYIKLTEQTEAVPANTGLIIAGEGTVTIPVVATANPLDKDNYLVAVNKETTVGSGYVLSWDGSDQTTVGFYVVDETPATVKAGQAYLSFPAAEEEPESYAKVLRFVFGDGTATAVEAIEVAEAAEDGVLYNVAGQQVGKDYKGIVIKNGKKYLNK